ncbi:hypothetical protein BT63DRAFT_417917 [Microthyrium microscopicum]|uniref:DUF7730 domain-containing protein n=1 Tax=Microthyrium microscopicum TaxID=703497 RepID=A0A6A6U0B4_9PEZI|nr:hypothetical protein BT63DRAFT_417917 [Microthyrium microscopicum]
MADVRAKPTLQTLPAEIRLMIFEYLLVAPPNLRIDCLRTAIVPKAGQGSRSREQVYCHKRGGCKMAYNNSFEDYHFRNGLSRQPPALKEVLHPQILRACRQFYHEAHEVLYKKNAFEVRGPDFSSINVFDLMDIAPCQSFWRIINNCFPAVKSIIGIIEWGDLDYLDHKLTCGTFSEVEEDYFSWMQSFQWNYKSRKSLRNFEVRIREDQYDHYGFIDNNDASSFFDVSQPVETSRGRCIPNSFALHRRQAKILLDMFKQLQAFQGDQNCWEWNFTTLVPCNIEWEPVSQVRMVYSQNPRKEVLCEVVGDVVAPPLGKISRFESLQ